MFKLVDLSHARKVFVVGDIHGCFSKLEEALVDFDPDQDFVISVGDLVDRGPESSRALEFLAKPWFIAIRGNHEDLTINHMGRNIHFINGGDWVLDIDNPNEFIEAFSKLPTIMEVILPSGKHIGIVHADVPFLDWNENVLNADDEYLMWNRSNVGVDRTIRGIDHVYFGHTPMEEPVTAGNCSWIDTGACFYNGKLTIMEVF